MEATTLEQASAPAARDEEACLRFVETLAREHRVFCGKTYRVELAGADLPLIPCLDHEAQLQGDAAPHVSVYLEDSRGELHEVSFVPSSRTVTIDAGSTLAETPREARTLLASSLRALFPECRVAEQRPSWVRGDTRVASVVRSQVRLRDVLAGEDTPALRWRLERLRAIAELMEKESRVSSWGVRTLTAPLLGAAGVGTYVVLGTFARWLPPDTLEALRYTVLTLLGGAFLWVGMKAVHLTEMGTRVWKRATEYRLILEARQRAAASCPTRQSA